MRTSIVRPILGSALALWLTLTTALAAQPPAAILSQLDLYHPVEGRQGMVATQEQHATRVGLEILDAGGNAVDAAVAVGFALAVTLPRAGNLGGGGFMLVHDAATGETVALDFREMAPRRAHRDLFLDQAGNVDPQKARFSHLAAGVPGTVAGLSQALATYGTMPLERVVAPAIALAENGFDMSADFAGNLVTLEERFKRWPASTAIFFKRDGSAYQPGERFVQADLAWSLRQIAEHGPNAFYDGPIADRIAADMAAHGGLIDRDDLRAYQVAVRAPVRGTYRGFDVLSMPPPSSGGVHLIQMLNMLEAYPIRTLGHNSAATIHLMAESMRRAYADRATYLGDPDHVDVPVDGLTDKAYAASLRRSIDADWARPSSLVRAGQPAPYESPDTTHYSVADRHGNVVSTTYTLNLSYGSAIVARGTGILLNNEMDDFSSKPGVPNAYGLIGGEANAIAAGKRPLSSMTPTLLLKDGKPFLATGSPGGSRIITTVLQIVMNVVDHGMNIAHATYAPRIHHQWLPDQLRIETGLSMDTLALLRAKGHTIHLGSAMGSTQSIMVTPDGYHGASDPRRPDALTLGH